MEHGCSGNCGSCSGCAQTLELAPVELELLQTLAQIPFLPVARRTDDLTPVYLEERRYSPEEYSLALQCMEKKGLIDLDYRQSLAGFAYRDYAGLPCRGTIALTQRGQTVVELLDLQGIESSEL